MDSLLPRSVQSFHGLVAAAAAHCWPEKIRGDHIARGVAGKHQA
jgi:hypothetical protein